MTIVVGAVSFRTSDEGVGGSGGRVELHLVREANPLRHKPPFIDEARDLSCTGGASSDEELAADIYHDEGRMKVEGYSLTKGWGGKPCGCRETQTELT